ncbi:hypothetical protein HDU85_004948 [Gaertneriomyces sp. JEL0708]|nr:hypothetical protein HDU85_004948 [Gaertneriomyces sp. JEL0708]
MMGESRTELLAWLNDLLQLGYTKVEQCGTGAAHCQIMDSIFRDVPLTKVKFDAKHEYEYVQNFKVLQGVFDKHKIEQAIPVERLIKCKFQDNLEFLQWVKKYWHQLYPGGDYDAVGRRRGQAVGATRGPSTSVPPRKTTSTSSVSKAGRVTTTTHRPPPRASTPTQNARSSFSHNQVDRSELENLQSEYQKMVAEMQQQVMEAKVAVDQVEKEREFYFAKLREIEVYVQSKLESGPNDDVVSVLNDVSQIMYKTEDGFEIPAEGAPEVEQETF